MCLAWQCITFAVNDKSFLATPLDSTAAASSASIQNYTIVILHSSTPSMHKKHVYALRIAQDPHTSMQRENVDIYVRCVQ